MKLRAWMLITLPALICLLCLGSAPLQAQTHSGQHLVLATAHNPDWTRPLPGHRVIGNLYAVGTWDLGVFLITSDAGHILVNTGLADSLPQIKANVEALGFEMQDIRILLTMQAHYDHVGALADIQALTGAEVFATAPDARLLEDGGASDPQYRGSAPFTPVRVSRILRDQELVTLGDTQLTVHEHPGHTEGSSSYTLDVEEGGRRYRVALVNMATLAGNRLANEPTYPGIAEDYMTTFARQKTLQPDIWVAAHGSQYGLHDKWQPGQAYRPDTFVDPEGYQRAVDSTEQAFAAQWETDRATAATAPASAPQAPITR